MGGSASTPQPTDQVSISAKSAGKQSVRTEVSGSSVNIDFMVSLVMPLYYTKADLSAEEKEAAMNVWKLIINNRSDHFFAMKEKMQREGETCPYNLCSDYFSEMFYVRLFDTHPSCKGLFANSKMKMRMNFMGIITLLLNAMDEDKNKFVKTLQGMAKVHNIIGVKAVEYGIGCAILMYAIQKSIGPVLWTPIVANAWAKIFSRILDVIIPVVIRFEVEQRETSAEILAKRHLTQQQATHVTASNANSSKSVETMAPTAVTSLNF